MRLNRFLSLCGLGSRRGCEQIILEGRVSLNGRLVKELGTQVATEDKVTVDGKPVRAGSDIVIALNKPRGYICTRSDERDRMTIYDLLPKQFQSLHHVGRLDKESEGLILLTNRGDLSHHLIHPSKGAEKEYEVIVDQALDQTIMAKLVKGMLTEEGHAKAERAWMITEYRAHVVLKQGLKRQIRLMFYQLGFEVERLTRTRIGWLEMKGLPRGGWKELSATEVERFFSKEGATGRAPRADKPRPVSDSGDEGEDTVRPTRKTAAPRTRSGPKSRTPREVGPRSAGKGRAAKAPPFDEYAVEDEETARPARKAAGRSRSGPGSRAAPREDGPRRGTSGGKGRPGGRSSSSAKDDSPRSGPGSSRSFDKPRAPRGGAGGSREDGPRRSGSSGGSRPAGKRAPTKRSGGGSSGPRRRSSS